MLFKFHCGNSLSILALPLGVGSGPAGRLLSAAQLSPSRLRGGGIPCILPVYPSNENDSGMTRGVL